MKRKQLLFAFILILLGTSVFAQNYERYKRLTDTVISSKNLRFEKKISVTVPVEWQKGIDNSFPLIIVFDRQNKRSHNYILNTIDYLTSTEQMPSCIVISVDSEQRYRYLETQYKISDPNGLASENEKFIFDELIPLAEQRYNASGFRVLIGHSRYGYFTTALFSSRINNLNGVIAMSPFFDQKNVDLTDSISKISKRTYNSKKYYRFIIGNDFPDDYVKMDSVVSKTGTNRALNIKGHRFAQAGHDVTPGLLISTALYEIFEDWSAIQAGYTSVKQKDLSVKRSLDKAIASNYGAKLNFSIGALNGKGWHFYNEKQYDKAIEAWEILLESYPNFSEAYLYIIKAKVQLKQSHVKTADRFKKSLFSSVLYTEKDKKKLEMELQDIMK